MRFFLMLLAGLLFAARVHAQERKVIALKSGTHAPATRYYYIARIDDRRSDTTGLGSLHSGMGGRRVAVQLKGGAARALMGYVGSTTNPGGRTAVTLVIDELQVSEKRGAVQEEVQLTYSYTVLLNSVKVVSYSGDGHVATSADASGYIDQLIRQSVDRTLAELDQQWEQVAEAVKPPRLEVTVTFAKAAAADSSLIAYSRRRPLTIADFRGQPDDLSVAAAATYCGLGINMSSQTNRGVMRVNVEISVFADPAQSWMRLQARNAYILDHEQLHFDLAGLAACRLRAAILGRTFEAATLQDELMRLYRQATAKLTEDQQRYDRETAHSRQKEAQATWKSNLEDQLAQQDCF